MINDLNLTVQSSLTAGDELSTTTGVMINVVTLTAKHPAQQGAISPTSKHQVLIIGQASPHSFHS